MESFGKMLRERARQLNLSDAEVARRAGLNERRYGHYVTGKREPDLATLLRICGVLKTTPNVLLGFEERLEGAETDQLTECLISAVQVMAVDDLRLSVKFADMLIAHRRDSNANVDT